MRVLKEMLAVALTSAASLAGGPGVPSPPPFQDLEPELVSGWNEYVGLTEERMARELESSAPFLALDFGPPESAGERRRALLEREVLVEPVKSKRPDATQVEVPGGLIHHWRGAILVPGATLEEILEIVMNPGGNP